MPDLTRYPRLFQILRPRSAPDWRTVAVSSVFATTALGLIGALHSFLGNAILVTSLGGSAVIAFGMPDSEMAQPRSLLGGHALSCLVGIALSAVLHPSPWAGALAVGVALAIMQMTSTVHSPAGADPLIILASNGAWQRPMIVLLSGLLLITLFWRTCRLLRTPRRSQTQSYPLG